MRRLPLILSVLIAGFLLTATLQRGLTQDTANSCPTIVRQALEAVGNNCGGLSRNSACYGFNRVNAIFANELGTTTSVQLKAVHEVRSQQCGLIFCFGPGCTCGSATSASPTMRPMTMRPMYV